MDLRSYLDIYIYDNIENFWYICLSVCVTIGCFSMETTRVNSIKRLLIQLYIQA